MIWWRVLRNVAVLGLLPAAAAAQCIPITEAPIVISESGSYCLAADLAVNGELPAVTIDANFVDLNLAGFTLTGPYDPSLPTVGISSFERSDVVIRNGSVAGFRVGVEVSGASEPGYRIRDMKITDVSYIGVLASGTNIRVERCRVTRVGGSTIEADTIPVGILVEGAESIIADNIIREVVPTPGGEAVGIVGGLSADGVRIDRNVIVNPFLWPQTWGIWLNGPASGALVRGNLIVRYEYGITFPPNTGGTYVDNELMNVPNPFFFSNTAGPIVDGGGNTTFVAYCDPIYELPWVIDEQGRYCLVRNLSTPMVSGAAVSIVADEVLLDLRGFKIGGGGAGLGTQAYGVHAVNRNKVTVRNGNIRGFFRGVFLEDMSPTFTASSFHLVEGLLADDNTETGIHVQGESSVVRGNQVVGTGGTTAVGPDAFAYGVRVEGRNARVLRNDISNTTGQGFGVGIGIVVGEADSAIVENNRVAHTSGAKTAGITIVSSNGVLAVGNRISLTEDGLSFWLSDGKYADNLASGVLNPYLGGTSAGNNQ
jgi:hypothetical protein